MSSEVKPAIEAVVTEKLQEFLLENPGEARAITSKIIDAARAREVPARRAREMTRRKGALDIAGLPGNWPTARKRTRRCRSCFGRGRFAGGSAKQGRDRRFQAILPLKGKILNVEKGPFRQDAGFGGGRHADHRAGLRHRPRGVQSRQATLLSGHFDDRCRRRRLSHSYPVADVFYRQMPELIERGHIYIAQPPLYKIKKGKQEQYVKDEGELSTSLLQTALDGAALTVGSDAPPLSGAALEELAREHMRVMALIQRLSRRYDGALLEQLVYQPALDGERLRDGDSLREWAERLVARLNDGSGSVRFTRPPSNRRKRTGLIV